MTSLLLLSFLFLISLTLATSSSSSTSTSLLHSTTISRAVTTGTSSLTSSCVMPVARPPASLRKFTSSAVESFITNFTSRLRDPNLATLFANTMPNTLDTTVFHSDDGIDSFIVTGDITAMWLRDSTNQVWPYLSLVKDDIALRNLFRGLINRQAKSVLIDPYANAFNFDASQQGPHADDDTTVNKYAGFGPASNTQSVSAMTNSIFERKYEADSLSNVLRLGGAYWLATGDLVPFTNGAPWVSAAALAIATLDSQRAGSAEEDAMVGGPPYLFQRSTGEPSDTLEHSRGALARRTGLIKSAFRGSDDATILPFSIPENIFASAALRLAAPLLDAVGETKTAAAARTLADAVDSAIATYGTYIHPITSERIYAYELDGFGNYWFQDDANIPSLLALPIFATTIGREDPLYAATRRAVLSDINPYYFCGSVACGVGGQHNGAPWIWPMALAAQSLTSDNATEISNLLTLLIESSACTGLIHESFHSDDFGTYTRPWFAWMNSLFAEVIIDIANRFPALIF
jgi:meiotically up-regulated gene 157 (Mug157) protein